MALDFLKLPRRRAEHDDEEDDNEEGNEGRHRSDRNSVFGFDSWRPGLGRPDPAHMALSAIRNAATDRSVPIAI